MEKRSLRKRSLSEVSKDWEDDPSARIGKSIYISLVAKYYENSPVNFDEMINGMCFSLLCLKSQCRDDMEHALFNQRVYEILERNQ